MKMDFYQKQIDKVKDKETDENLEQLITKDFSLYPYKKNYLLPVTYTFNEIDESIGSSGEEYEILFSFDEKNLEKINKIALKHKVELNIFAKAIKGKYRTACKNHHF